MVLVQDHHYNNKGVVTNGMYVLHKPQDHEQWHLNKEKENRKKGKSNSANYAPATSEKPKPASVLNNSAASKLSLSKSLQAALVTTAGITENQFKKIWKDACNASGN
jgi:hypothetical protein